MGLVAAVASCRFDADFSGEYRCETSEQCPTGQVCAAGVCRPAGPNGPGPADAAAPGGPSTPNDASDGGTLLELRVAALADDAEEVLAGGLVDLYSADLELGQDGDAQMVGIRFASVDIPPDAEIVSAHIQFTAQRTSSSAMTYLQIRAEASDSASPIAPALRDLSTRRLGQARVNWSSAPWTEEDEAGAAQRTPDLREIVEEVVRRPGWSSGNAILFLLTGAGGNTAAARDASADRAPLLRVVYRAP